MAKLKLVKCTCCDGTGLTPAPVAAEQLREMREKAGVSLRQLATIMDISYGHVSDVERGNRGLSKQFADNYVRSLEELGNGKF